MKKADVNEEEVEYGDALLRPLGGKVKKKKNIKTMEAIQRWSFRLYCSKFRNKKYLY